LVGVRDPYGIRPLVIGKLNNSYVLSSETCALDIIGAKFVREVDNGEIVLIKDNKIESIKPFPPRKIRPCVFEYIYFSRPDSILNGKSAYEYRKNLGKELAKESTLKADIVVPVPDSGNAAALGFAQYLGINFELGLTRNHYVGRTFIEPAQKIRSLGVKLKLNANKSSIKNKIISKGKKVKNIVINLFLSFLNNGLIVFFFLLTLIWSGRGDAITFSIWSSNKTAHVKATNDPRELPIRMTFLEFFGLITSAIKSFTWLDQISLFNLPICLMPGWSESPKPNKSIE